MRHLLALILFVLLAMPGLAQSFQVSASGCLRPGGSFAVTGSFGSQTGDIVLVQGQDILALKLRGWSTGRVRLALPDDLDAGSYALVWRIAAQSRATAGPRSVTLGTVTVCREGGRDRRVPRDVVRAEGGGAEYLVSVAPREADAARDALTRAGAEVSRTTPLPQLGRVLLAVSLPGGLSLDEARDLLDAAAPSATIDLHHIYGLADGPRLYAAALVGDDPARACPLRRSVRVGIIDGPVNTAHPALSGVETISTSVLDAGERPASRDHGTAVAALIAGRGEGFQGFAPGARLYAVTAFGAEGGGSARLESVALGLDWLASQGVGLVNLSMEGSPNATFEDVLTQAQGAGLVMVAAMGNEGTSAPRYPAASDHTIAVTAVDAAGRAYDRANTGPHVDLAAPGVDLYVARGAGGGYRSGTSYAAPIVTALIARLSDNGPLSLGAARAALARGARDLGEPGPDSQFGLGLVQTGGC